MASSNTVSETLIISQRSSINSCGLNETIMIKSTKSEHCTTAICQDEDILSVNEKVFQESSCEFSGPSVITIDDESICQGNSESECSVSQNTHEANDGYQSGESKMSNVQRLCQDCNCFYKKVRKSKQPAIIKDPHTTDPRPWYSKSWIFVNRFSAKGRKTLKRDLENVLKRIKSIQISRCTPAAKIYWTCCRSHLFLKRNIRLCKEEQKRLLFVKEGEKMRKQPNSGRKSRRPKKCVPSSQAGKKTHKTYSFVLDSSQEEDANPKIKRYKLEIENTGRKPLLREAETYNSTCSSRMALLDQQGAVVTQWPLAIEPTGHDTRSSVYSVPPGSFREQLKNMGRLKSAIINEN